MESVDLVGNCGFGGSCLRPARLDHEMNLPSSSPLSY